ncbi:hypothetical protein CEXT_179401 [Caerostris extrusa]|uniref:Uncharacterized protein n=1 Tax=Caerostris extrusa TaxID=172846 RepID=A0AAV4MC76_CAEEX|nr:hypothetical protein CEXT_179401 [Caerostris extrusa]
MFPPVLTFALAGSVGLLVRLERYRVNEVAMSTVCFRQPKTFSVENRKTKTKQISPIHTNLPDTPTYASSYTSYYMHRKTKSLFSCPKQKLHSADEKSAFEADAGRIAKVNNEDLALMDMLDVSA